MTRKFGRNTDGTFAEGNSGKPKGARHRATIAIQNLLDQSTNALTKKVVELALEGDTTALRLCLERICPPRKDSPIKFALPKLETARDASKSASSILESVANGQLTPLEAASVMGLIDSYRRLLETSEIETRIEALEAQPRQSHP